MSTAPEDFYRIKRLPPYIIAEVNAMRAQARAGGEDIIELVYGSEDFREGVRAFLEKRKPDWKNR